MFPKTFNRLAADIAPLGGKLYWVGGAVRDSIMGGSPRDFDVLLTGIHPNEINWYQYGCQPPKAIEGTSFAPFAINTPDGRFDLTMPRRDDGTCHPDGTVERDLFHRDFTINAMAIDIATGDLVDPFGGLQDIKAKRIEVVTRRAMHQDPVRILRGLRLAHTLQFTLSDAFVGLTKTLHGKLAGMPVERVRMELEKGMTTEPWRAQAFWQLLVDHGVAAAILPDVFPQHQDAALAALHYHNASPQGQWAGLLHGLGPEGASRVLRGLKFPDALVYDVRWFLQNAHQPLDGWSDYRIRKLMADHGNPRVIDNFLGFLFMLAGQRPPMALQNQVFRVMNNPLHTRAALKVNGKDLQAVGYAGKDIGRLLGKLHDMVMQDPAKNDRDFLLNQLGKTILVQQFYTI
jgi:tRNA nucleotidyltransferase/poly(A) polymerase